MVVLKNAAMWLDDACHVGAVWLVQSINQSIENGEFGQIVVKYRVEFCVEWIWKKRKTKVKLRLWRHEGGGVTKATDTAANQEPLNAVLANHCAHRWYWCIVGHMNATNRSTIHTVWIKEHIKFINQSIRCHHRHTKSGSVQFLEFSQNWACWSWSQKRKKK